MDDTAMCYVYVGSGQCCSCGKRKFNKGAFAVNQYQGGNKEKQLRFTQVTNTFPVSLCISRYQYMRSL